MNRKSPIYRAIESRGEGKGLPLDFSSRMMSEIRAAERRRQRTSLIWSVVGYLIAVAITAVATIHYCGSTLGEVIKGLVLTGSDIVNDTSNDLSLINSAMQTDMAISSSTFTMAIILSVCASILLTIDYLLRKKFTAKFI